MELLTTIFGNFLPDALRKAEQSAANARHSAGLNKVDRQLRQGSTLRSCNVSDSSKQEAELSFAKEAGYTLKIKARRDRTERFENKEELDHYLLTNTKFRIDDFLPR